jgi:hypothetical protein
MAADFESRNARMDAYQVRCEAAAEALGEVLLDPELGAYEPKRAALIEVLKWLEIESTCGDCVEGRCHWGGSRSRESIAEVLAGREYVDPAYGACGCARHEASVEARDRQAKLLTAGVVASAEGGDRG